MILASLFLTMSTCLSYGCNDVAKSINMEALDKKSTVVIESFDALYDFDRYDLSLEKELTLFKANLMTYVGNYNLLQ